MFGGIKKLFRSFIRPIRDIATGIIDLVKLLVGVVQAIATLRPGDIIPLIVFFISYIVALVGQITIFGLRLFAYPIGLLFYLGAMSNVLFEVVLLLIRQSLKELSKLIVLICVEVFDMPSIKGWYETFFHAAENPTQSWYGNENVHRGNRVTRYPQDMFVYHECPHGSSPDPFNPKVCVPTPKYIPLRCECANTQLAFKGSPSMIRGPLAPIPLSASNLESDKEIDEYVGRVNEHYQMCSNWGKLYAPITKRVCNAVLASGDHHNASTLQEMCFHEYCNHPSNMPEGFCLNTTPWLSTRNRWSGVVQDVYKKKVLPKNVWLAIAASVLIITMYTIKQGGGNREG